MKRLAIKVMMFLLLGAIVNVAVAWGGLLLLEGRGYFKYELFEHQRTTDAKATTIWNRFARDGWTTPPTRHQATYGPFISVWSLGMIVDGSYRVRIDATAEELKELYRDRGIGSFKVEQIDCGFPFASLRLESAYGEPIAPYKASRENNGLEIGGLILPKYVLPVRFAINTIFYAAVLWLLWTTPFLVRRRRRIKRGLCPACAYPVGTSPVCTECGEPVESRKTETQKAETV